MQGFSNSPNPHTGHYLTFDSSLPMPFKIPVVLQTLLNPKTNLNFSKKQEDLIEALRFSYDAKDRLFANMLEEENALLAQMTHEGEEIQTLKDKYNELQTQKMEASEICFDLINALADDLDALQYQKLLELSGVPS